MQRLGLHPKGLPEFFASEPASVRNGGFARMYLLKPAIFVVLSLFWISTAFVSLGPGWDPGMGLMREGGVEGVTAALIVVAGALSDCVTDQPLRPLCGHRYLLHLCDHRDHTCAAPLGGSFRADAENLADYSGACCSLSRSR
jgi:hypothetical protein